MYKRQRYGLEVGYAFQIADDLLDYAAGVDQTGKARGQDLREGKVTLPLLCAMEAEPALRDEVRELLRGGPPVDDLALRRTLDKVQAGPGPAAARELALAHSQKAIDALAGLPEGQAKSALVALAEFVVGRRS